MLTWTRPGGYLVVYLDVSWGLPGLEPGRKKTFNFEGTKTFKLWNGSLVSDSEGSKSQKNIQFPADQVNPGKKAFNFPGVVQVFARCCPGVSRQKKMGETAISTHSCVNQQINLSLGFTTKRVYHSLSYSIAVIFLIVQLFLQEVVFLHQVWQLVWKHLQTRRRFRCV